MDFKEGTQSILARCVSAELRARLAAKRISGKTFSAKVGMSQNYFATRLRDEKPFTLDDINQIVLVLEDLNEEPADFILTAYRRHGEDVWMQADDYPYKED